MIKKLPYLVLALIVSCSQNPKSESNESLVFVEEIQPYSSRIAFGSCNNAYAPNELWDEFGKIVPNGWDSRVIFQVVASTK